jgi:hypothetical protein
MEIAAVYSENLIKLVSRLFGQNTRLYVEADDTHNYHEVFERVVVLHLTKNFPQIYGI